MTEDLEAIDVLSDRYADAVKNSSRYESTDALILVDNSPLIPQGEKVLRMYEAEAAKAPDDFDVKASMAQHLYRIGWMYYDAVIPRLLHHNSDVGDLATASVRHANQACNFMVRSYQLVPNAGAAFVLADLFRLASFYGTSLYWLDEAGKVSTDFEDAKTATRAKAQKLDLQADGKTTDPKLSRKIPFPSYNTPGLITANQSNAQDSPSQISTQSLPHNSAVNFGSPSLQPAKQQKNKFSQGIIAAVAILFLGGIFGLGFQERLVVAVIVGTLFAFSDFFKKHGK